jgi:anti-sigma regulatory factor (Ser/Thr protein kinase)
LEVTPHQYAVLLYESSQVGEARRAAARAGQRAGMGESDCARVSIVASELAANVIRHARSGELLVNAAPDANTKAVEIIAIDRGPGMADPGRCMADGYSTAGSLGHGLGAIQRLSARLDIYSAPGRGTAIYSRIEAKHGGRSRDNGAAPQCAISVPVAGETQCGDNWCVAQSDKFITAVVADGLGHGPLAARAANEAIRVFGESPFAVPEDYLTKAHEALQHTRGAAVACARVDREARTLLYAGVGNIAASIVSHRTQTEKALPSHNGIVGHQLSKTHQFEFPVLEDDLLVMHSDGLTSRWKLDGYPGLSSRVPALIAAVLYRDFKRARDDATVLVVRLK